MKDALSQAGYETDLPPWTEAEATTEICGELGLPLHMTQGEDVTLRKGQHIIIGAIQDRSKPKRLGHWFFTKQPEIDLQKVNSKDIFAIIEIPEK